MLPDEWFVQEVLSHEAELTMFLYKRWSHRDEVKDLRQEIYARLLKYAQALDSEPANTRALIFSTARNLMIDRIRRLQVVSFENMMDFESLNVIDSEPGPDRQLEHRTELLALKNAMDNLPDRTRAVIYLRRVEGISQKETAKRLNISEPTVERHLAKGVRKLAEVIGHGPRNVRQSNKASRQNNS